MAHDRHPEPADKRAASKVATAMHEPQPSNAGKSPPNASGMLISNENKRLRRICFRKRKETETVQNNLCPAMQFISDHPQ